MLFSIVLGLASIALAFAHVGRITNGKVATPGQFPYQVGLMSVSPNGDTHLCGGSLISNEWVLTAAHCTSGARYVKVFLGSNRIWTGISYEVSGSDIINHPGYSKEERNDIGLIKIPSTNYTSYISPISLPPIASSHSNYAGEIAVASGWGLTNDITQQAPTELQWARMPIIKNAECRRAFGNVITEKILCVSTIDRIAICGGDSGGPLVLQGSNRVLVGVSSFGAQYCTIGYPSGFMRVTSYLTWIRDITGLRW